MDTRRVFWAVPIAAVLAAMVAGCGSVGSSDAQHSAGSGLSVLRLLSSTSSATAAEPATAAAPRAAALVARAGAAGYVVHASLPPTPANAAVYRLQVNASALQALASALQVKAPITKTVDGWQAGQRFSVLADGQWQYAGICPPNADCATPVGVGPWTCPPNADCATPMSGGVAVGPAEGSAGSAPNRTTAVTTAPIPLPAKAVKSPAIPLPVRSIEPLPVPSPPPTPSDSVARAAAAPVLSAEGLSNPIVAVSDGQVTADPVVDGARTVGEATSLSVAKDGTITAGSGWLDAAHAGSAYPLISAAAALKELPPRAEPMIACLAPSPGHAGGCPSFPRPVISHVELGLTLNEDSTGPLLVPAWLFTIASDPEPAAVIAVQPRYLGTPIVAKPPIAVGPALPPSEPMQPVPAPIHASSGGATTP